jgi:hypothetical protein
MHSNEKAENQNTFQGSCVTESRSPTNSFLQIFLSHRTRLLWYRSTKGRHQVHTKLLIDSQLSTSEIDAISDNISSFKAIQIVSHPVRS